MSAPMERLADEIRDLAAEVEDLVKSTAHAADENVTAAARRVKSSLQTAASGLERAGRQAADQADACCTTVDDWVHENPWTAVGATALACAVIGFLAGRR